MLLLLGVLPSFAQSFVLTGRVRNFSGKLPVEVNMPVIFGHHHENTVPVPVDAEGAFQIALPADSARFATLIFRRQFYTLLLEPGKNVTVELDETHPAIRFTGGSAAPVCRLINDLRMDAAPFFWENDSLGALPADKIRQLVIAPYAEEIRQGTRSILAANISPTLRQTLIAEWKYLHYNYLHDFLSIYVTDRNTARELLTAFFDTIPIQPASPHPGPQYYAFADHHLRFLEMKAAQRMKAENLPSTAPIPYFGISMDSAQALISRFGKSYLRWIGSIRNFPPDVAEAYNWQQFQDQYHDGDITQALGLAAAFRHRFPQSRFLPHLSRMADEMQARLASNADNPRIRIWADSGKAQSIFDVVRHLKGKVVLLDVWGTWCGPCKAQLRHLPALRQALAGKDVAFLFLAMEEDDRVPAWKDFIRANNMEGLHLRKNRQGIAPIWQELLAGHPDKAQYYPQYFLFDKSGKLAVAKAGHPGNGDALLRQIGELLDQQD